jgi:erythromycin esterase
MSTWGFLFILAITISLAGIACEKDNKNRGAPTVNIPFIPLNEGAALDSLMQQIDDARIVMLGEATHGTHEFYQWRAAISKRLIAEKGFSMIGAEGKWADSYRVNGFIQGPAKDSLQAVALLRQYDRWPTWMWGNYEVTSLVTWLNQYNQEQAPQQKAGFFGLDVYCLWGINARVAALCSKQCGT